MAELVFGIIILRRFNEIYDTGHCIFLCCWKYGNLFVGARPTGPKKDDVTYTALRMKTRFDHQSPSCRQFYECIRHTFKSFHRESLHSRLFDLTTRFGKMPLYQLPNNINPWEASWHGVFFFRDTRTKDWSWKDILSCSDKVNVG
jgi:hypothetical protein